MTSAISAEQATEKAATDAVVEAKEITRVYGEGETAVRALNGCSVESTAGSSRQSWARPAPASRR